MSSSSRFNLGALSLFRAFCSIDSSMMSLSTRKDMNFFTPPYSGVSVLLWYFEQSSFHFMRSSWLIFSGFDKI